jgi:hypothetical protein
MKLGMGWKGNRGKRKERQKWAEKKSTTAGGGMLWERELGAEQRTTVMGHS